MSARQMRKLCGGNTLPPPEGISDEEYEPLYTKNTASRYQELVLSSHSESEHESTDAVGKEANEMVVPGTSKKKRKTKKKQRKTKQIRSMSKENLEMDEIDKSVMEVNALLGAPSSSAGFSPEEAAADPVKQLFSVTQKHLNVANELKRLFGPESLEKGNKKRGRQPNLTRLLKKAVIVPVTENSTNFQKFGLSMSVNRRENGITYFTFDHSKEYQRIHRSFLQYFNLIASDMVMSLAEAQKNMHIEALLESVDAMFQLEEYTGANTIVEQIISYMQYVAHPSFNLTDFNIRLEYNFLENRPFHIVVLKYLHLLTNRACHRTALELAKLLLILDPSDPLAIIFIIDTLALRAREHKWLIDAVDHWKAERHAGFLFNVKYSYALAYFHVITKEKGDIKKADKLIQTAMMQFPSVFPKLIECANMTPSARLQSHAFFTTASVKPTEDLNNLIFLYAKFTWPKWREPNVWEWLIRNATVLVDKYDADDMQFKELTKTCSMVSVYQSLPPQIIRHLSIIKPMSNLLVDGAVPRISRVRAFDPIPGRGVDRYGYLRPNAAAPSSLTSSNGNSVLYDLFTSLLPNLETQLREERRREDLLADFNEVANDMADAAAANLAEDGNADINALADAYRRYVDIFESEDQANTQPDRETQDEQREN